MDFDRFTFGIYRRPPAALVLSEEEAATIQDAHMAHLAKLTSTGEVLAAGPLDDQEDVALRGIVIFSTSLERARLLSGQDPAVRAGSLSLEVMSWVTPAGEVRFAAVPVPESMDQATS
jgi:uncharacterized protein YciI